MRKQAKLDLRPGQEIRQLLAPGGYLVVIPDDDPPVMADSAAVVRLRTFPGARVHVLSSRISGETDLLYRVQRARAIIFSRSAMYFTRPVLAGCRQLDHIVVMGAAADSFDDDAARKSGIRVTHTPDNTSDAVAEHALALTLALARKIPELDQRVRAGEWPRGLIAGLAGKTLGIAGSAPSGTRLAKMGAGIGMKVIAWLPEPGPGPRWPEEVRVVNQDALLSEADVVSIHVRRSESSGRMFGAREFARMKPAALFVNTERAGLVDEAALARALASQTIGGAALDVFAQEPLQRESPLMNLPNVILSPHTGASVAESLVADQEAAVNAVIEFISETAKATGRPDSSG